MFIIDTIKMYATAIKFALGTAFIAALIFAWWYHGHQQYLAGKTEVQALWDADKAVRKIAADKQAAAIIITNQEHKNELDHSQATLRDTRNNLNAALERLRNLPALPGGEGMLMAGSGCTAVSSVATNTGRIGIRIEKRIGRCEDSGSDPCYTTRDFFEQAIGDALNKKGTREWAAGQGISTQPAM
jgi:hypothetical protein